MEEIHSGATCRNMELALELCSHELIFKVRSSCVS